MSGARMESLPPTQQLGKYRLVATLGQGGMGTVYLALASGLGQFRKVLVVKELRQDLTRNAGFVSMFMDEAKLTARLDHPNVVQTFEAGEENERYYLAMEYLDGQPLSALIDRLADSNGLPLWVHIQILCEVLAGLHYAHELPDYDGTSLGVVHRDVSPQNVFVTYHGQVKVVDFGVAKAAGASTLTDPGVFKGKFAYAAPEQVLGRPIDARTDVFAVGVMLWEAITGRRFSPPLATPTAFRDRTAGREPRIHDLQGEVDPLLAEICDRALAVDPDVRFPTANAFRAALQEFLSLSGVRVEAPEIGQFMRDVFARERRDVHMLIERAMKHGGASESSVEALPFMNFDDPSEATAIADLSSLVDVSHERDDEKIRAGYAHSKVTLMKPQSARAMPMLEIETPEAPASARVPNRWLIASMVLSGMSMVGLVTVLLTHRTAQPAAAAAVAPPLPVAHLPAAAAPAAATPQPSAAAPATRAAAAAPAADALDESDFVRDVAAPHATQRPMAGRRYVRARAPEMKASEAAAREAAPAANAPAAVQVPQPAAPTEMGSELRRSRRGDARIDVEDPYQ
jgi:eukaryotic-like serine/threonine-protein kinase